MKFLKFKSKMASSSSPIKRKEETKYDALPREELIQLLLQKDELIEKFK
jgi:hypothetical protein